MIIVHVRTAHPPTDPHRLLATLTVHDDGSHTLEDPDEVLDLEEPMVAHPGNRRVVFANDPAGWARALPQNLRSPYLYAELAPPGRGQTHPTAATEKPSAG